MKKTFPIIFLACLVAACLGWQVLPIQRNEVTTNTTALIAGANVIITHGANNVLTISSTGSSGTSPTNLFDANQFTLTLGTNVHISPGVTLTNLVLFGGETNSGNLSVIGASLFAGAETNLSSLTVQGAFIPEQVGPSVAVVTGAGSNLVASTTTAAELAFVHNVTSAIQTQLNAKGSGTVTSVGLTGDGVVFVSPVSGSPVTTSGTLGPVLVTQPASNFLASPATTSGPWTARTIAATDIPALPAAILTSGTLVDGRLSANVPLLNGNNVYSGNTTNVFGRIATYGAVPTVVTNGGNGIGGNISGIVGTDTSCYFTLNLGTSAVGSTNVATVTFARPFGNIPTIVWCFSGNDVTEVFNAQTRLAVAGVSNTGFTLMSGTTAPASSKSVNFSWIAIGQ